MGSTGVSLRTSYAVLILFTILVGLVVHLHGIGLGSRARDVTGDALWASMIFWIVSLAAPRGRLPTRAAVALAVCFVVEFGQRIDHPILRAIRGSTLGHLAIGSDFDGRDLLAYAAGIAAAVLLDGARARAVRRGGTG